MPGLHIIITLAVTDSLTILRNRVVDHVSDEGLVVDNDVVGDSVVMVTNIPTK